MLPEQNPNNGQAANPQVKAPPTFTDSAGNEWTIKFTLGLFDEIRDTTQVDLVPDDLNLGPLAAKALNFRDWANLLWLCIRKQAETRGVTQKDFTDGLDEDVLADSAEAIGTAIHFFIQRTRGKDIADATLATFKKGLELANTAALAILENMESPRTQQAFKELVQEAVKEQQAEWKKEIGQRMKGELARSATS